MKKLTSILVAFALLISQCSVNFATTNLGTTSTEESKPLSKVTFIKHRTSEGYWKTAIIQLMGARQIYSTDPNEYRFAVTVELILDGFVGSPNATLANNFPISKFGSDKIAVDFKELSNPLLGDNGPSILKAPYKGKNSGMLLTEATKLTISGEMIISIPTDETTIFVPMTLSDKINLSMQMDSSKLTDISPYINFANRQFGNTKIGQITTSLDLVENTAYESLDNGKQYILRNLPDGENISFTVGTYFYDEKINSNTLKTFISNKASNENLSMSEISSGVYSLKAHRNLDQYEAQYFYDCGKFYRMITIKSKVKFENTLNQIVDTFRYDNSLVSTQLDYLGYKNAIVTNHYYSTSGDSTRFKSTLKLFTKSDTLKVNGTDSKVIYFTTADQKFNISQRTSNSKNTLDSYKNTLINTLKNDYPNNSYKNMELVKGQFFALIGNKSGKLNSVVLVKKDGNRFEETRLFIDDAKYLSNVKEIIASIISEYKYKSDLNNKIFK